MTERKDRVEVYEDAAGEFRWRRIAANGELIGESGEGYTVESHARDAAKRANGEQGVHVTFEFEEPE